MKLEVPHSVPALSHRSQKSEVGYLGLGILTTPDFDHFVTNFAVLSILY